MKEYVVGFLLRGPEEREVVLIRKSHPEWQKGRLNGVGGHIEANETPREALVREFLEETGMRFVDWELLAILGDQKDWVVYFFAGASEELWQVHQTTDEQPEIWDIDTALVIPQTLPNLRWLLPLAQQRRQMRLPVALTEHANYNYNQQAGSHVPNDQAPD